MKKAIITVYYPSQNVVKNIRNISEQVDITYVLDNSPNDYTENIDLSSFSNVKYVRFGENLGLSKAFNTVLCSENFNEDDYIVFFDQDSTIEEGHIESLISEYELLQKNNIPVGVLGPVFYNTSNGLVEVPKIKTDLTENSFKVSSIITSSMLCTYKNIKQIGFFNERVFLDMADWDICWRIIEAGMLCCMTDKVVLKHSLGTGEKKVGFLRVRVGSPFREYYQTRECLYLLTRRYTPFKFKIRFILMLTVRPIIHVLFLENKKDRIKYILKGIKDFFAKKSGAL